ncbi:hypothetical protein SAMN05216456_3443 [Devosia crocina]|uniref:Uncharacterized protein n=1 Tax=Devosia crocina TaxID=429728 RepID=A0A1I7NUU6_9HYPH|nr:hypothetical protein [Devosia crocina]SFV38446.1 hypothetical protein SAMN05216456_3443 [Devosia crocina]
MMKAMVIAAVLVLVGGATVQAQQNNWGQEVKSCNQTDCYPGGTSRGEYVKEQARDGDGPGYGSEIHELANPGKSSPRAEKFR